MLSYANSLYVPSGRYKARGWILLPLYEYERLNSYSTSLQLDIGDTANTDNVNTIKNLSIVQAQCVTRGVSADPNSIYLIELTDARGVIHNEWFQFPLNAKYNIRSPAYPQTFNTDSIDGSIPWTWSRMLQTIWTSMPLLGAWPGLPITPSSTPEGFWFSGVPAWQALNDILDYLGLSIACDLTSNSPYTIVIDSNDDPSFNALQSRFANNLEDDLDWVLTGAGRVPGSVLVLFRRRNEIYGSEETVTYTNDGTSQQWDMKSIYSVLVPAPSDYTGGTGKHYIWSDFTVRYDMNSSPLSADTTTAATIASDLVNKYFNRIQPRRLTSTYAGALPFTTGSEVDGVRWYQDYSEQSRQGWKTQVVYSPGMCPWPELYS